MSADVIFSNGVGIYYNDDNIIYPVKLTNSWCRLLGFDRLDDGFIKHGMVLAVDDSTGEFTYNGIHILYVHQLQNLYLGLYNTPLHVEQSIIEQECG